MSFLKAVTIMALLSVAALAGQREIVFPEYVLAAPQTIEFTHNGKVGVVLGGGVDGPWRLFSFSILDGRVLDAFDLSAELGAGIHSLDLCVCETGVLAISSLVLSDAKQKAVVLRADQDGQFSKLWSVTLASSSIGTPTAVFNEDGTKLWAFYNDEQPKLVLFRTEDGASIASIDLPDHNTKALMVFDKMAKRPIVKSADRVHILAPEKEGLRIEWSGDVPDGLHLMDSAAISQDGRFMFGYGGSSVYLDPPFSANNFMALALETKEFHLLSLKSKVGPAGGSVSLDSATGTLFVPYSLKVKIKRNGFMVVGSGSNLMDILHLSSTGDISQAGRVELALSNLDGVDQSSISPFNNVALSQSGALGFVSSLANMRVFSFDTLTGEVVNDVQLPDAPTYIYRPGSLDVLVYANGTNKLVVLDITTGPVVKDVQVKRHRTIIKGANFLFGARVRINGEDIGVVDRSPDDPGRQLIINLGKREFPAGQEITIVVTNRDGLSSSPFTFSR